MEVLTPSSHSATDQLRTLASIARAATSGLARPQRALLDGYQRVIFETDLDIDALTEVTPAQLAEQVDDPAQALQLIRFMVVLALADGPPSAVQMELLTAYARALGVDEPAVDVIGHLARGHRRRFRIAFLRRSHMRHYMKKHRTA